MKIIQCRICDQKLPDPILSLPDTPIANDFRKSKESVPTFPLKLTSCANCSHYQLNYSVDADNIFNQDYVFVTGTSPVNVKYFNKYAEDVARKARLKKGDFVFEVAANDGTLLKAFKKLGMKVLGVDPAVKIANKATKDGVEVIPEFFTKEVAAKVIAEHGKPKLIIANNVLAHVDNINEIISGVKYLLDKNGIFVFENSYFKDMVVNNLPDLIYHEHKSHFLCGPLDYLFTSHQLSFYDAEKTSPHGGSIRGFVSPTQRPYSENLSEMLHEETRMGLRSFSDKNIKMSEWGKKITKLKTDLNVKITEYKKNGKKIACYGAPAKFTTLSYILDLNSDTIDYVVDDNPLKQEKFTPGKNIPVVSISELKKNKPDVIIITAWNFAESIIDKCKKNGYAGKFIIPLPHVETIE